MFRNYLKIAFRNLWKNKVTAGINLLGLTIGLSCCLLIGIYIQHEVSYDNFQQKGDRIVRVIMEYSFGGEVNRGNYTSTKVAPSFKKNFPEVEAAVRMFSFQRVVALGDKTFNETNFMFADSTYFDIFTSRLLQGNPQQALEGPYKVLLTASTARKYFGTANPVGQTLNIGPDATPYAITGILEDCPSNSQIKFDFLASFSSLGVTQERSYFDANYTTYLLLKNSQSISTLQPKITPFMKKELGATTGTHISYELEPFNRIHLHSAYGGFEPNNNITYIYVMAAVALLILAIACFTYVNLGTARSMERAREVGIRKVIGALKNQLFWQFIGESVMLTLIALGISVLIVILVMPWFNQLAEKELQVSALLSLPVIAGVLLMVAIISLFAGGYPALILARFQPVKVLKGSFKNTSQGIWLRKSLIVFQFVISVFLVVATLVMQHQLHYIQNKNLGFNRDHILVLPMDSRMQQNLSTLKTAFAANTSILHLATAVNSPVQINGGYNMRRADMPNDQQLSVKANPVDEGFVQTTGLKIIAGTDFTTQDIKDVDKQQQEDKIYHFILNESAAREMGWKPEEAIGQNMFLDESRPGIVKAVVKDFHFQSLHDPIKPLVLFPEIRSKVMLVKVSGQHLSETITFLESRWKELVPHRPFEYHFMDEDFNKLYSAELRLGYILNIFTVIALILACLGLFGLSSYAVQQRVKEIGIRKILGASAAGILGILSKDFIRLAFIAMLISFPVAWWVMERWLQDFTYRINISGWVFIIAAAGVMLVTIVTISIRALRAVLSNPVKALRSE